MFDTVNIRRSQRDPPEPRRCRGWCKRSGHLIDAGESPTGTIRPLAHRVSGVCGFIARHQGSTVARQSRRARGLVPSVRQADPGLAGFQKAREASQPWDSSPGAITPPVSRLAARNSLGPSWCRGSERHQKEREKSRRALASRTPGYDDMVRFVGTHQGPNCRRRDPVLRPHSPTCKPRQQNSLITDVMGNSHRTAHTPTELRRRGAWSECGPAGR